MKNEFQVKVNGSNDEMLRAAAEQFGDKTVDEIMFGKLSTHSIYSFFKPIVHSESYPIYVLQLFVYT